MNLRSMFESKRLSSLGKQVALVGAALLLMLVASISQGRTSEAGSRLTAQVLRQVMRLRAHDLRRPNSAQTRTSRIEHSDPEANRNSAVERLFAGTACLHSQQMRERQGYRLIPPCTVSFANAPRMLCGDDVERARAPPTRG